MFQTYIKSRSFRCAAARLPQSELAEFIQYFQDLGYAHKTIHRYLCAVIHFADWMTKRGMSCSDATARDKREFVRHRMSDPSSSGLFMHNKNTYAAALSHWIRHLANDVEILSTNNKLVEEFDCYLREVAGLAKSTCIYRCRNACEFLNWLASSGSTQLNAIQLTHLSAFVHLRATQVSLATVAATACSLNSFIRFLSARGYCEFAEGTRVPRPKLLHRTPSNKSLTTAELSSLLDCIDRVDPSGKRDYILLLILYNTGARVSELVKLQVQDVDLARQQAIHFFGKGRKERIVPLWLRTITELKQWLVELPQSPTAALIPNRHGEAITRFGVKQRLDCAVNKASQTCPSLKNRHISPHSIRHTTAMHLLQSGVDLTVIALWLGHAKLETTHQYMQADIEMKREALAKLPAVGANAKSIINVKSEDILVFLENL